jgi:hypothetical protein
MRFVISPTARSAIATPIADAARGAVGLERDAELLEDSVGVHAIRCEAFPGRDAGS